MTTAVQIGETSRDRADFCRCFKTGAAVFLHDDGIVAHSTYKNPLGPWGRSGISEVFSSFIDRNEVDCLPRSGPQSKRRAAGRTLEESSSGLSFSNFDGRRANNFQFKTRSFRKRSPTTRKRLRDLKTAVRCTLDRSDCSFGKIIASHFKSLVLGKNH